MFLSTDQINPRLLKCAHFNGYENMINGKMTTRICYDYEIEYYLKSDGGIIVDNKFIPFASGDINIRKPGQVVCGVAPYECYIICVDMRGNGILPSDYAFGNAVNAQPLYQNRLLSSLPDKLTPKRVEYINSIISEIYRMSQNKSELSRLRINALLYQLMYELASQCISKNSPDDIVNFHIKQAVKYISVNFCEDISIKEMVDKSGLSKAYFHRCFKAYTKTTPASMIISLRIEKAKTLLCVTNNAISEISQMCGFYDNVYFSYLFKKLTGFTPREYRRQHILP